MKNSNRQRTLAAYIGVFGMLFIFIFGLWVSGCEKQTAAPSGPGFQVPDELIPFEVLSEIDMGNHVVETLRNGQRITAGPYDLELRDFGGSWNSTTDTVTQTPITFDSTCIEYHIGQYVAEGGEFRTQSKFYFPQDGRIGWAYVSRQQEFIPILKYYTGEIYTLTWDTVNVPVGYVYRLSR